MYQVVTLATAIAVLLGGVPTLAHHAVQAQFDFNRQLVIKGTVKKMEWINPHPYLHVDVKDETTGQVRTWLLETISLGALRQHGIARNAMKFGDAVTADIFLAKDGSNSGFLHVLTLPDGRNVTLFFGETGGTPREQ